MEQRTIVVLSSNEKTSLAAYEDTAVNGRHHAIIDYSGQKSGKRDDLVLQSVGGLYIRKEHAVWKVVGMILSVSERERVDGVRRFEIVVKKTTEPFTSSTKQGLLRQLNFVLRDHIQGISYADMIV